MAIVQFTDPTVRPPHCLYELAMRRLTLQLRCRRCAHSVTFDPHALWWLFERKGWDQRLKAVGDRFHCQECAKLGRMPPSRPTVDITDHDPTDTTLRRPPMLEWTKAVRRRRS